VFTRRFVMPQDKIVEKAKEAAEQNLNQDTGQSVLSMAAGWISGIFRSKSKEADRRRNKDRAAEANQNEREKEILAARKKELDDEQDHLTKINQYKLSSKRVRRRERSRKEAKDTRRRFGARGLYEYGQAVDYFSPQSRIILEDNIKKQSEKISVLIEKDIKNKSISNIFDEKVVLNYLKGDEKKEQYKNMLAEYEALKENLKKVMSEQPQNEAWKGWSDGNIPSESARQKLVNSAVNYTPGIIGNLPVVGPIVSKVYDIYGQFQVSFSQLRNDISNIFSGTRRNYSLARIGGMLTGSIAGAVAVGGAMAVAGSIIPGVGTIIGGTAGIIAGAVMGAAAGGPVGVDIAEFIASKTGNVDEREHEMEYRHLRQLRKAYGLRESEVLKMHSYLINQIKVHGPDSGVGVLLSSLKEKALEEGRENALAKLCIYFMGQEQTLRDGLYQVGIEYVDNQKERVDLLALRRKLESDKNTLDVREEEYQKGIKSDALDKLNTFSEKNHIQGSSREIIERYIALLNNVVLEGSSEEVLRNKIMEEFGVSKSKAEAFKKDMTECMVSILTDDFQDIKPEIEQVLKKRESLSPNEQWEQDYKQNEKDLLSNSEAAQFIEHKRFEMRQERDEIINVLKEFKQPSEFMKPSKFSGKKKPTWIYGDLMKHESAFLRDKFSAEDPIKNLFEPVVDHNGNTIKINLVDDDQQDLISKPKGVRSLDNYKSKNDDKEESKALFRENMRASYLQDAQSEAQRYDEVFWQGGVDGIFKEEYTKNLKSIYPDNVEDIDNLLNVVNKDIPKIIDKIQKSDGSDGVEIHDELTKIQGMLLRAQQEIPELESDLKKQLDAIADIQHYTQYAMIQDVYIRRDLAIHDDSGLNDIFPFTKYGMVEHLKEGDDLISVGPKEVKEKMKEVEIRVGNIDKIIVPDLDAMSTKEFWVGDSLKDDERFNLREKCQNNFQINLMEKLFYTVDNMPTLIEMIRKNGIDDMTRKKLNNTLTYLEQVETTFPTVNIASQRQALEELIVVSELSHAQFQQIRSAKAYTRETAEHPIDKTSSQDIDVDKEKQEQEKKDAARKALVEKMKADAKKESHASLVQIKPIGLKHKENELKNNKDDEEKLAQEKSKESNPDDALLDPDVNQDPDIAIEEDKILLDSSSEIEAQDMSKKDQNSNVSESVDNNEEKNIRTQRRNNKL